MPDTNQFHGDPRMRRSPFRVVMGQHLMGELRLVIPEIVLLEVPKLYARELDQALGSLTKGQSEIDRLGGTVEIGELPDPDGMVADFETTLREELRGNAVNTPEPPESAIMDLAKRSAAERRPFQSKGRGLRDALIWDTVVELAAEDAVALMTANHKDFADRDNHAELHPDLKEDLAVAGLAEDRVRLFESIQAFISARVPSADGLEKAQALLAEDGEWGVELYAAVTDALHRSDPREWDEVSLIDEQTNADLEGAAIEDVTIHEVTIENAYAFGSENEVVLHLRVGAEVTFSMHTTPWGAEWLLDERIDVDLEEVGEALIVVTTAGRPIEIEMYANFAVESTDVSQIEEVEGSARNLASDVFWPERTNGA